VVSGYVPRDDGLGYGGASAAGYAAWLDLGKEMVGAIPGGLVPDVVIAGQEAGDVAAAEAVVAGFGGRPLLVGLTWFGPVGPRAGWRGSDAVIQALSGVAYPIGPREGPPILPQGHAPQVVGGVTAFIGAMGALIGRRGGQAIGRVEANVLEAFMCLTEHGGPGFHATGVASRRHGVNLFGPVYPQTIFATADGWIGVTALTPLQWQELCGLIGLPELARDARYETTDLRMAAAAELDAILGPAIRKLKAGDLLEEGQRRRVPLAPVPTMAEVLATPHWRERGSFQAVGAGVEALAGIRVLDLSMGWSGPLAGRHFADLGAEVIKIEGCSHVDWWRGWNALVAADLLIENYAPGVLGRLGFSAEAMAAINPRLSYISMGAFGSAGPWSGFRAYGSTTEQAAGMPFLQGEAGGRRRCSIPRMAIRSPGSMPPRPR
jgi:crotonobetainyl-CoA:carnitine CoA-transferase CaiB-like acyl-CoA transferase